MKHFQQIIRMLLGLGVIVLCLLQLKTFANDIGVQPPVIKYKKLVECLQHYRPELQNNKIKELGIVVLQETDGAHFYMQMALAPIRTVHSSDLPVVLVLSTDKKQLADWITAHNRKVILNMAKGLVLTYKQETP